MQTYRLNSSSILPSTAPFEGEARVTLSQTAIVDKAVVVHQPTEVIPLSGGVGSIDLLPNSVLGDGSYYTLQLVSRTQQVIGMDIVRTIGSYIFIMPARDCDITDVITVVPTAPEPLEASKAYASEAKGYASESKTYASDAKTSADASLESAKVASDHLSATKTYADNVKNEHDAFILTAEDAKNALDTAKNAALKSISVSETTALEHIDTAETNVLGNISTDKTHALEAIVTQTAKATDAIGDATQKSLGSISAASDDAHREISALVTAAETAKADTLTAKSDAEKAATDASGSERASALSATTAIGAMGACTTLAETCTTMQEQCSTDANRVAESLNYIDTHHIGQFFESLNIQALLLQKSIDLSLHKFHAKNTHDSLTSEINTLESQNAGLQNDVTVLQLRLSGAEVELEKESRKTLEVYAQLKYKAEQQRTSENTEMYLFDLWRTASNTVTSIAQSIKIFNLQGA